MKNDPFYPNFDGKPDWLIKAAHVPRSKNLQKQVKELVESAKSGNYRFLAITSGKSGRGMTHFLNMELMPALEAEGAVCMLTGAHSFPTNSQMRNNCSIQKITEKLATPIETNLLDAESQKWLSEGEKKVQKWLEYREKEKIPVEPKPPYLPKILSQSIDQEEQRGHVIEFDEYSETPWEAIHRKRKEDWRNELSTFHSLSKLAQYNGKALCAISESSLYLTDNKRDDQKIYYEIKRMGDPYIEPGVIRLVCLHGVGKERLERACEQASGSVISAALEPAGKAWTEKIILAHQTASGKEWFTINSIKNISLKFAGKPQSALYFCRLLARKAETLPITEENVDKELVNKRWENDSKAFKMEF